MGFVFLVALWLSCGSLSLLAAPSATPTPAPTSAAPQPTLSAVHETPSPSPTPTISPSPIVPPRDAPPVRSTTPPFTSSHGTLGPPLPDSLWLGSDAQISVPMTLHSGRPFIDVILDGHPSKLLVDTAMVTTLVDPALVDGRPRAAISLQIGELRFPHILPDHAGVQAYSSTNLGAPADGVIGRDLLSHYPVEFDFPNRMLVIFRDSKTAAGAEPQGAVTSSLQILDSRPAVQASLDRGAGLWFALATGEGVDLQLDPTADRTRALSDQNSLPFYAATITGQIYGRLVRARSLAIGGASFEEPLVAIVGMQEHPASQISGSLGAAILSNLNLFIDESAGSFAFVAPAVALAPPSFDPSGITLVMRGSDIVVRTVVSGSPGDSAHIRTGDVILSIDGLVPATLDFARSLLDGNPGTKIAIAYRRWGRRHVAALTLRTLI